MESEIKFTVGESSIIDPIVSVSSKFYELDLVRQTEILEELDRFVKMEFDRIKKLSGIA